MNKIMQRTLKATLFVAIGTATMTFIVALIAVLVAHPTRKTAFEAIFGSIGLGIVIGSLSFPFFYLFFKGLLSRDK